MLFKTLRKRQATGYLVELQAIGPDRECMTRICFLCHLNAVEERALHPLSMKYAPARIKTCAHDAAALNSLNAQRALPGVFVRVKSAWWA